MSDASYSSADSNAPLVCSIKNIEGAARTRMESHSSYASLEASVSNHTRPVTLPSHLSWLKHTIVEMTIDQEGFHDYKAVFKLKGFHCGSDGDLTLPDGRANLAYGKAEFVGVERQVLKFHQSLLESPPTLRRLTLNGDETRDYLSRQASLTIRANGVYTVGAHSDGGLEWRLVYLVDDRYEKGKIKAGQKTLTPLGFTCSPGIVHPSHGRKIGIMRVMVKTVAPKLVAERVNPPRPPGIPDSELRTSRDSLERLASGLGLTFVHMTKAHSAPGESASRTSVSAETPIAGRSRSASAHHPRPTPAQISRKRSSADGAGNVGVFPVAGLASKAHGFAMTSIQSADIQQHILPQAELSGMVSSVAEHCRHKHSPSNSVHSVDALSPPKYHSTRSRRAHAEGHLRTVDVDDPST